MRVLPVSVVLALVTTVYGQPNLPTLSTSLLTPTSAGSTQQQGSNTPSVGGTTATLTGTGLPTTSDNSQGQEQNGIVLNTLLVNTQDLRLWQALAQRERQEERQNREADFQLSDQYTSGVNDGTSTSGGNSTVSGAAGLSGLTNDMLTPLGDGFWTFASSAQAAPAISDSMATEADADTYVPAFMGTFWNNYQSNKNQDIVDLINVNNVHLHNFNIQPLIEIDLQFQAQPQAQAQANGGLYVQDQWASPASGVNSNSSTASNAGSSDNGNGYGNNGKQGNDQWGQQKQQDNKDHNDNNWPTQQDTQWPFDKQDNSNSGSVLDNFISNSGNRIIINTLTVNAQRKSVKQVAAQEQEQSQQQSRQFSFADQQSGYAATNGAPASTTAVNNATSTPAAGTTTTTAATPTGTVSNAGGTQSNNQQQSSSNNSQQTFAAFQFNFNNIVVRNKNVQVAIILAAQAQLEAEAQAQLNGPIVL